MVRLISAIPRAGFRLCLEYDDGFIGEADLSDLVDSGVFRIWRDPGVFESVSIGKHGQLRWTDDIELCSDALYLKLTGKTVEEFFSVSKAPVDA